MSNRDDQLAQRLDRLERENLRLKRWGIAAGALAGVALLASAASVTCKTVWAERFVLRDTGNRERAVLTAYETGGAPQLSLLDEDGERALTFGVAEDGIAYMEVPGDEGPVRRTFGVGAEGTPSLKPVPESPCGGEDDGVAQAR